MPFSTLRQRLLTDAIGDILGDPWRAVLMIQVDWSNHLLVLRF